MAYNGLGWRTQVTDPCSFVTPEFGCTEYGYDSVGNGKVMTDANLVVTGVCKGWGEK